MYKTKNFSVRLLGRQNDFVIPFNGCFIGLLQFLLFIYTYFMNKASIFCFLLLGSINKATQGKPQGSTNDQGMYEEDSTTRQRN